MQKLKLLLATLVIACLCSVAFAQSVSEKFQQDAAENLFGATNGAYLAGATYTNDTTVTVGETKTFTFYITNYSNVASVTHCYINNSSYNIVKPYIDGFKTNNMSYTVISNSCVKVQGVITGVATTGSMGKSVSFDFKYTDNRGYTNNTTARATFYCNPGKPTDLTLDTDNITIEKAGYTANITVSSVTPADADKSAITWSSSNPGVAAVTGYTNGVALVSAYAQGYTYITAKCPNGKSKTALVHVLNGFVPPAPVPDPPAEGYRVKVGETKTWTFYRNAKVTPLTNAYTKQGPTYSSNLEGCITIAKADYAAPIYEMVDQNGYNVIYTITGVKPCLTAGTVRTTIEEVYQKTYGPGYVTAYETFDNVYVDYADPTSIKFDQESVEIEVGQEIDVTATQTPLYADPYVTFSSQTGRVAILAAENEAKATIIGSTVGVDVVTVTDRKGHFSQLRVNVKQGKVKPQSIAIENKNIKKTETGVTLDYKVLPEGASQNVVWYSYNPEVATVDLTTGVITPVSYGQAVIQATTAADADFPGYSVSEITTVSIVPEVGIYKEVTDGEDVRLDTQDNSLTVGDFITIYAKIIDTDPIVGTPKFTIETSDYSIARIVNHSYVTAKRLGAVTFTATCKTAPYIDAKTTASFQIKEVDDVEVVFDDVLPSTIYKGEKIVVSAHAQSATKGEELNPAVTWSSSDWSVASVIGGTITGKKAGTVTITATSKADPAKSASFILTVLPDIKTISIVSAADPSTPLSTVNLTVGESLALKTVDGDTGAVKSATMSSSDWSTARVIGTTVTAKKPGTVTITATAKEDASVTDTITVNVTNDPEKMAPFFNINPTSMSLGGTMPGIINVDTNIAGDVNWVISNPTMANIVSGKGYCLIMPYGVITGTCTVTGTITDKNGKVHTQVCNLTTY